MKTILISLLIIIGLSQNTPKLNKQDLIGKWENVSLTVEMPTYGNSDSTSYLKAAEGEWEKVLKIKPIQTTFNEDGSFSSSYFDLDNKPMGIEQGTWFIRNDSLVLVSNNYGSAYKVTISGDKARFKAFLDWDQDGKSDDLYDGWQKRLK